MTALTNQAQAIVNSNIAQAQLLHDMGMISVTTLTDGYTPGVFVDPYKNGRAETLKRWAIDAILAPTSSAIRRYQVYQIEYGPEFVILHQ